MMSDLIWHIAQVCAAGVWLRQGRIQWEVKKNKKNAIFFYTLGIVQFICTMYLQFK